MEALRGVVKARYVGESSMWAWRLHEDAVRRRGERLDEVRLSMQDQYSLQQREEEREMFGLLADGVSAASGEELDLFGDGTPSPPTGRLRHMDQPCANGASADCWSSSLQVGTRTCPPDG
jgi:hypothetical protein